MTKDSSSSLTGTSRVARNVIISWVSHIFLIITGFFLPRVIDMQLGQFALGVWDFSWSLVSYMNLSQLGIGTSLNRFVSNYRADKDTEKLTTAISTVIIVQFILATLIFITTLLLSYYVPRYYGAKFERDLDTAQWVIFFLGSSLAAQFLFDTSRGILTGCHRWDVYNFLYSSIQVIGSITMIVSMLHGYGLITISAIYLGMTILDGLIRSVLVRVICPECSFSFKNASFAFFKKILRFGIKSITINMPPPLVIQGTNLFIGTMLGYSILAIFARPISLIKNIETFITRYTFILTPMAGPMLTLEGEDKLKKFTVDAARYGLSFTLPAIIIFCWYGDDVIRIWMGDHYVNHPLIITLGLGFLLPMSQSPILRVLIGLDKHGRASVYTLVSTLIIYVVGLILISIIGPTLERMALLIGVTLSSVYGIFLPYYACRALHIDYTHYLRRVFLKVSLLCIGSMPLLVVLDHTIGTSGLYFIISIVLYMALISALYWYFLLPQNIKQRLTRRFSKKAPDYESTDNQADSKSS